MLKFALKLVILLIIAVVIITHFGFEYSKQQTKSPGPNRTYEKGYFRSPLNIPLYLSGTFGELRNNHFHSGLDIKTNAKEGLPVYATASGYISRVRVQTSGFGKALYITHPNGFVTVYAHLKAYNPEIARFAKKAQYSLNSFELDTLLGPGVLHVEKGELIAYSGNTGSSGGPHLHFEIRDAVTEEPINPLLFGFNIADNIKPVINQVYVYPLSPNSSVAGSRFKQRVPGRNTAVEAFGEVGVGIDVYDLLNGSANHCGIYSIELKSNGKRVYYSEMERYYFDQTRYINSHCDYREKESSGRWIQKSFLDYGNRLNIYKGIENRGRLRLSPGETYQIEYIVKDTYGNTSVYPFTIKTPPKNPFPEIAVPDKSETSYFPFDKENLFIFPDVSLRFPPYTFYDTIKFEYSNSIAPTGAYSVMHHIHNRYTPVHDAFELAIRPVNLPDNLRDKAIIYRHDKGSAGGTWDKEFIKTRSKNLGSYYIKVDTAAPYIKPVNIANNKNMSKNSAILLKISDNLSGIKTYLGTIDGKWVLMDYDAKYNQLAYYFDENCPPGKHTFELTVSDNKNNIRKFRANFTR